MKAPRLALIKILAIPALAFSLTGVFNPLAVRGQTVVIATNTTIDAGTTSYDGKSLIVSNATLTVTDGVHPFNRVRLTNSASLVLEGGSIQGAVITAANGTSLVVSSGTLDGVTVNGNWDVGASVCNANLTVLNGLTNNGTLQVGNPTNLCYGEVRFAGTQTFGGNGTVVFGNNGCNILRLANDGTTLTIGPGLMVRGQSGQIGWDAYGCFVGPQNVAVVNRGTISAEVAGGTIVVGGQPLSNLGLIESPAGTVNLAGTLNGLGNIQSSNGPLILSGMLTNTGQAVLLRGTTNVLMLQGGTILGGTISSTNGASLIVQSGVLDGVTVNGDCEVGASVCNATLTVVNGLTNNGTLQVGNPTNSCYGEVRFAGTQTLGGNGTVVFGNYGCNMLRLANDGTSLTLGPDLMVRGQSGQIGWDVYGCFVGPQNVAVVNRGTISADVAGGTIVVGGLPLSNLGLIESPAGTVNLAGTLNGLGNIQSSNGPLILSGMLTNTGQAVLLRGTTNVLMLEGGTILGGTITSTNGASLIVQSGVLDGVTVNGDWEVGASVCNANLTVVNGLTNNGTLQMGNPTNSCYGEVRFAGTQTFGGRGTVVFGNYGCNMLGLANDGTTLTIGPDLMVRGQSGQIGWDVYGCFGGSQNVAVVNNGTISADIAGGTIVVGGQPLSNLGLIESPAGTVNLAGTLNGLGNIRSGNGALALSGVLTNTGQTVLLKGTTNVLTLQGGTILGGTITSTNGASLIVQSGVLDGVTVSGNWDVGASACNANLTVVNGLTNNGTLQVGNPSNLCYGEVRFAGTQTLGGNGTVVFGNYGCNMLRLANGGTTLTIGPGLMVRGQNGRLGYDTYGCFGGPSDVSIINHGVILADTAGGTIGIYAQPLTNVGTLSATLGTLTLNGTYDLAGGALNVGIGGLSSFGNITFSTLASFGGTITLSTLNGYVPNPGDTFDVLNYPSATNSFTCLGGLDLGGGILFQPQFSRTSLRLQAAAYTIGASQPQLFINRTLGGTALTWPNGFPGWTLRSTTNLFSPTWTMVTNPCGNQVVVPISTPQKYFRLDNGN